MVRTERGAGRVALLLFSFLFVCIGVPASVTGCKRGVLMDWLREHNASQSVAPARSATIEGVLHGTDCPDGLARCVAGAVEVSHVARVPSPCPQATTHPEECQCPWEAVETCARGCSAEGTEIVTPPAHAAARLCAPDPLNPPARPAPAAHAPAGACAGVPGEGTTYRCVASLIVACEGAAGAEPSLPGNTSVLAACIRGCAQEGETLDEEESSPEAAARILCARARAP